ncbi:uncharacterized protein LOC144434331 [Glandiceps talaboti]
MLKYWCIYILFFSVSRAEADCGSLNDGGPFTGKATFFTDTASIIATGSGKCMLTSDDTMVAGRAAVDFDNSEVCGQCAEVTGPYGDKITVRIIDECSDCLDDSLNLSEEAFEILESDLNVGIIDITWSVVTCPITDDIQYRFKAGSSQYWFGIQAIDHLYPISLMQVRESGSSTWVDLERQDYNFFLKPTSVATLNAPMDIKLTSTNGFIVQDTISQIYSSEDQYITSSSQFVSCDDGDGTCLVDEKVHTGQGTYYMGAPQAAAGSGTCMMNTEGFLDVGAMAIGSWRNSETCGECIEVTGPNGDSVYIIIIDQCPSCAVDDIDLSLQAFEKIAAIREGRIEISWKVVECPFTDTIKYKFKDGSTKWWFGIQIVYHRLPVESVTIKPDDEDTWIELSRTTYNFFLQDQRIVDVPFSIRMTGSSGEVLEDRITHFPSSMSDLHEGNVQFSTSCIGENLFDESDYFDSIATKTNIAMATILLPVLVLWYTVAD